MSRDDPLKSGALTAALAGRRIGHKIVVLEEVSSTNDFLAQIAAESDEGVVVVAEEQKAGRGQYGRRWESAKGKGLWLSVLLRPEIAVAESGRITAFLAETIAETIRGLFAIPAAIKPPNDVYSDGRKLAGVLVEMRVERAGAYCAIAGLGINVNHELADFPPELRATAGSLALAAGKVIDRTELAIALLRKLDERYAARLL